MTRSAGILIAALLTACAIIGSTPAKQTQDSNPKLKELVQAETDFAGTSVEKGVRESFLAFFADDGISFEPGPTKKRESLLKQSPPAGPQTFTLDWKPVFAEVSRAGDLGYTTGPYSLRDKNANPRPARYGYYFSIWRRQPDNRWKVVLDLGIRTGQTTDLAQPAFSTPSPSSYKPGRPAGAEQEKRHLIGVDQEFSNSSEKLGARTAYQKYTAENVRLHRNGMMPITEKSAAVAAISGAKMRWKPLFSDVAASADLGYTYGEYTLTGKDQTNPENGYYVRVWKRTSQGKWKVVLDTTSPSPATK